MSDARRQGSSSLAPGMHGTPPETAFRLAFRITGDRSSARAACEAAYAELARMRDEARWDRNGELALLARVRSHALELRQGPVPTAALAATYQHEEAARGVFAALEPVGRRAIELCYFAGMSADEIADELGVTPPDVRLAMRRVLLALGASAKAQRDQARGRPNPAPPR